MTVDALIVWCPSCQAMWDMDRDPGQCTCDGDVDAEQELFIVTVRPNGPLWFARCAEHPSIYANDISVDDAISKLLPLLKSAIFNA